MNDEFLHALRREPPSRFASELKRRLDRQSARRRRSSIVRVMMGLLLIGGAAVAAALLLQSRNEQADTASITQPVPAAPPPAEVSTAMPPQPQQAVAPARRAEPQAAEPAAAAAPDMGIVTSALARPIAQAFVEKAATPQSATGPGLTVMEANDAFDVLCRGLDLVFTSRRILDPEFARCRSYGVEVVEWKLGYQAVVLTAGPTAEAAHLSPREIYLALARRIPDPTDGSRLIDNPNTTWHDVDARFDGRTIEVIAPADALVRDVFVQLVMEAGCETYPSIRELKQLNRRRYDEACHQLRSDGHYREARLSPTFVTQQLWAEPNWLALLPYSFYDSYRGQLRGTMLAGAEPTLASLADGTYSAGRPVYAYAANDRLNRNPFMRSLTFELSGGYVLYGYAQSAGLITPDRRQGQRPDFRPPAPLAPESLSPTQEHEQ